MLFAFIVALFKSITDKWNAYVITVHEHMKNKKICNDAMERAKAIERQKAEKLANDAREAEMLKLITSTLYQKEISSLIQQSDIVETLRTRVVMLENCVQQHEARVFQLEIKNTVVEKRINFDRMIICFLCLLCCVYTAGLMLMNLGI